MNSVSTLGRYLSDTISVYSAFVIPALVYIVLALVFYLGNRLKNK